MKTLEKGAKREAEAVKTGPGENCTSVATHFKAYCPICQEEMALDVLEIHASICGERTVSDEMNNTIEVLCVDNEWKTHPNPKVALSLYTQEIFHLHETGKPLLMYMDLRSDANCKGTMQLVMVLPGTFFHNSSQTEVWFQNLGSTGVTCLFEGQPDHLVPSSSQFLIESDLFLVAGRMLATLLLEDCPDIDVWEIINLVLGRRTPQMKQLR
ncbi:hypothetical protein AMELA_G00047970 [Ameiurus melas]|uniref:Uncharacterized protein n=1 Tax=Ameiurus melas TaxID=219545 RepID=A0A7J6B4R8_AMEME|nr:hypothetical protein AMELA_G00047970 [Ameiurus melas]